MNREAVLHTGQAFVTPEDTSGESRSLLRVSLQDLIHAKQNACGQEVRRPYISGVSSKHIAQGSGRVGVNGVAEVMGAGDEYDGTPTSERFEAVEVDAVEADKSCLKKHESPRMQPAPDSSYWVALEAHNKAPL